MGFIYMYESPNGKKYIGQTRTSIEKRRKNDFGTGYAGCPCFYNAINKFGGLQNFKLTILEEIDNSLLDEKEKYYISLYNTVVPNGYNIDEGGQGQHNSRKINQYNDKQEKIASYNSISEAAEKNNCSLECILHCLSGRTATGKGYYWSYENEVPKFKKSNHRKRIYQFDLDGKLIKEFESARNADRFYNFPMGTTASCANKNSRRKRVGEYIFTYDSELDKSYYNIL